MQASRALSAEALRARGVDLAPALITYGRIGQRIELAALLASALRGSIEVERLQKLAALRDLPELLGAALLPDPALLRCVRNEARFLERVIEGALIFELL